MMEHLGGPEGPDKIADRLRRYVADPNQSRVVDARTGEGVGWVGFWERDWHGPAWEIGWSIVPESQGRGLAGAATAQALARAREAGEHRFVHAFPNVENGPSNAICRRAGFILIGALDFEYPPGHTMRCNDWRYDLG